MTKELKFILAVIFQIIIIFTFILIKLLIENNKKVVVLNISSFQKQELEDKIFINLEYDISNLNDYYLLSEKINIGDVVYATLEKDKNYWRLKNVHKDRPSDAIFIKGKVVDKRYDTSFFNRLKKRVKPQINYKYRITYGIEQYYLPLTKKKILDTNNKKFLAVVSLDRDGLGSIKAIYLK